MRVEHAGEYALVASKGGAPDHPGWDHNLVAAPLVEVVPGGQMIATEVAAPLLTPFKLTFFVALFEDFETSVLQFFDTFLLVFS